MKKVVFYLLSKITGNRTAQELLAWNVKVSRLLMGIGTGTFPKSSGEFILGRILIKNLGNNNDPLIIFDVGANEGQFSEILIKELQDFNYFIHAFEPNSSACKILKENNDDNNHFVINNFGLGKEKSRVTLYYDKPNSVRASIYKQDLKHTGVTFDYKEVIRLDTLDNYCLKNNINHIDLLKLDVEGSEIDILMGGSEILKNQKVNYISFEFGECYIGSRNYFKDIYYLLKSYEMRSLFRITPSGYLHSIEEYNEKYEQFFPTNFLAVMI